MTRSTKAAAMNIDDGETCPYCGDAPVEDNWCPNCGSQFD